MIDDQLIENRTFDEIEIGETASMPHRLSEHDIQLGAPVLASGMISSLVDTKLPGPGAACLSHSLEFLRALNAGDTVTVSVKVVEKRPEQQSILLDCRCTNQKGEEVIGGRAEVRATREKIRRRQSSSAGWEIAQHRGFQRLLDAIRGWPPLPTAIAHPCSAAAIGAAIEAAEAGMIQPILVGPEARIQRAAEDAGKDLASVRIVGAAHSHDAAAKAVALVRDGEARALMKGSLHTDELMSAVVSGTTGLRTERRISHAYIMDVPNYPLPLIITDAAINIAPTLEEKADIVRNAIDLAHVIGIECPRVAILAAVETINPAMPSTLEAASLCKMADRGQISGGLLDGPLAFDNAVSLSAAKEKGIVSPVAGQAEILVVPNLEAGNMLAKQLTFLGGADAAGIVLGARVPIILTSRADSRDTRLASCALAVLLAHAATKAAPGLPQPDPA